MSKREDIITAALDIISEQGISALTLPVLFKRAHTGAGTFYHYFDDRSVLINGVFERCFNIINEDLIPVVNNPCASHQWFDDAIKALFDAFLLHPREMNFLYSFAYAHVMPERDFCLVIPSVALLTRIISQAQTEGEASTDASPIVLSRMVRAMLASMCLCYERGEYDFTEADAKRFADRAWAAIQ